VGGLNQKTNSKRDRGNQGKDSSEEAGCGRGHPGGEEKWPVSISETILKVSVIVKGSRRSGRPTDRLWETLSRGEFSLFGFLGRIAREEKGVQKQASELDELIDRSTSP